MREVLRLSSPINGFGIRPFEDEVIGGKYLIPKGQTVFVTASAVHIDPEVYGDDVSLVAW